MLAWTQCGRFLDTGGQNVALISKPRRPAHQQNAQQSPHGDAALEPGREPLEACAREFIWGFTKIGDPYNKAPKWQDSLILKHLMGNFSTCSRFLGTLRDFDCSLRGRKNREANNASLHGLRRQCPSPPPPRPPDLQTQRLSFRKASWGR